MTAIEDPSKEEPPGLLKAQSAESFLLKKTQR